jgi:hypothetical protein
LLPQRPPFSVFIIRVTANYAPLLFDETCRASDLYSLTKPRRLLTVLTHL